MVSIKYEFQEDMLNIKKELIFLAKLEKRSVSYSYNGRSQTISSELFKIFKANVYLQLYNVMEANVAKILTKIHDTINNDSFPYSNLKEDIKILWLDYLSSLLKKGEHDQAYSLVQHNISNVHIGEYIHKKDKRYNLSGNIDGKKLKELLSVFDISYNNAKFSSRLKVLKDKRNSLAHGNQSFNNVGRNVTVSDLYKYYKDVKIAYEYIFDIVGTYLYKRDFLAIK